MRFFLVIVFTFATSVLANPFAGEIPPGLVCRGILAKPRDRLPGSARLGLVVEPVQGVAEAEQCRSGDRRVVVADDPPEIEGGQRRITGFEPGPAPIDQPVRDLDGNRAGRGEDGVELGVPKRVGGGPSLGGSIVEGLNHRAGRY